MAISYHVYRNDGQGGAIDYSTAIATVSAASAAPQGSFSPGPLVAPSDNLFAVRAFDDVTGVEEANTARIQVLIDADGNDVSSRPNPVVGLAVRWTIGEVALISWGYSPAGQGGAPTRFAVTASLAGTSVPPGLLNLPSQDVVFVPGIAGYGCRLAGLTTATDWTIKVRAVGGSDVVAGPSVSAGLSKQSGALAAVDALVAVTSA